MTDPDLVPLQALVPYDRAVVLARQLGRDWGEPLTVAPLTADQALDRDGAARNRTVYLNRAGVPAHVIAHEVAHALGPAGEPDHGEQFRLRFTAVALRLLGYL